MRRRSVIPVIDRLKTYPTGSKIPATCRWRRRPCGRRCRTATLPRPARPSTKLPRPRTRPAITLPICGHGRSRSRSSMTRRSPHWRSSRRIFPKARGCGGPALPRPRPWSPKATSAAPRRSTNKRRSTCSPHARRQQSAAVYLEFAEARFQPRRAGSTARLQERAGVLCYCPGHGPAGPAMCGSRVPHRLLFAETRRARPRRPVPTRNFSRHTPTTRDKWKPATGSANACWRPASCRRRERPGGNC